MTLTEAMAASSQTFRPRWINLIAASEQTGRLARALDTITTEIGDDLERGRTIRNDVTYFVGLILAQLGIMVFLITTVVPIFAGILEEFSFKIVIPLQILVTVSEFISLHYSELIAGAGLICLSLLFAPAVYRRSAISQTFITYVVLPLPVFGSLLRGKCIESLASVLCILLHGGMPLPDALYNAARTRLPHPYRRIVEEAAAGVEQGLPLSIALAKHRFVLGTRFIEFVRLGESQGDLAHAFGQAGDLYRRRIVRTESALADALIPFGVFTCGTGVFIAASSVFASLVAIADGIMGTL